MHDIGTAVWVILVIIGVVSSLVSKAKKAAAAGRYTPQRGAAQEYVPVHEQAFMPAPEMPQPDIILPAPTPQPMQIVRKMMPARQSKPTTAALPEHEFPIPPARRDGTSSFRGMFDRPNLARAFVASQVFGPPKALQEQSIWSPRHSEPSI